MDEDQEDHKEDGNNLQVQGVVLIILREERIFLKGV